jgi:hypothetical protein
MKDGKQGSFYLMRNKKEKKKQFVNDLFNLITTKFLSDSKRHTHTDKKTCKKAIKIISRELFFFSYKKTHQLQFLQ